VRERKRKGRERGRERGRGGEGGGEFGEDVEGEEMWRRFDSLKESVDNNDGELRMRFGKDSMKVG